MTWDSSDRALGPAPQVDEARGRRVADAVMARLDSVPVPTHSFRRRIIRWFDGLGETPRFVMPMTAAAAMALLIGQRLQEMESAWSLYEFVSYAQSMGGGF